MSLKSLVVSAAEKVFSLLKNEPVAVWGVVLAAAIGVLPALGVSAGVVTTIGVILSLLGIPVVRGYVSPLAALEALIAGLRSEVDGLKAQVDSLTKAA